MRVSNELSNFVYNLAFKGFDISSKGYIEPKLSLTADEVDRILSVFEYFGFPSKRKMDEAINTLVRERSEGMSFQPCSELSLLTLPMGTALLVKREFGGRLRLLYAGHRVFYVIDDNTDALCPGDVLRIMALGVRCGKPMYCQLYRAGEQLHSENQMFYVDDIKEICCRMPRSVDFTQQKSEQHIVDSLSTIYAWKVSVNDNKVIVPYSEITEDPGAILRLDLTDNTIDFNKEYDRQHYIDRGVNVYDDILAPLTDPVISRHVTRTEAKGRWKSIHDGFEVFMKMSLL